jgi:hypothetical protein
LLGALRAVRAAGSTLEPTWDPRAREGVVYRGTGSPLEDESLRSDLDDLAADGYVEPLFVDRLSVCPTCNSHAINVREICLSCFSPNLREVKALFHFRCGFVGAVEAFTEEPRGRRCPKCRKLLQDLGTDHDSPGDYFACRACNAEFQVAEIGARCISCGARFAGVEMQRVAQRDVFAYRLTVRGAAALDEGRLLEEPREARRIEQRG